MRLPFAALVLVIALAKLETGLAAEPGIEFFEKKIRPVLAEHCYECHSVG